MPCAMCPSQMRDARCTAASCIPTTAVWLYDCRGTNLSPSCRSSALRWKTILAPPCLFLLGWLQPYSMNACVKMSGKPPFWFTELEFQVSKGALPRKFRHLIHEYRLHGILRAKTRALCRTSCCLVDELLAQSSPHEWIASTRCLV